MPRFNNPYRDVVFSDFRISEELCDEERVGIKWLSLADCSLDQMIIKIKLAIRDQTVKKNILVLCLQKYVGSVPAERMREILDDLKQEVKKQRTNKLIFGTAHFLPSHERVWGVVSLFNQDVQRANDSMGMPRANVHKCVMAEIPGSKAKRIRPSNWVQYQLGNGLGSHLSYEGCRHLIRFVMNVFDASFCDVNGMVESSPPKIDLPPSLNETPGYKNNLFFTQVMAERGIIDRPLPRGEKRLRHTDKKLPGSDKWHIYNNYGKLERYYEKEGMLEAYIRLMEHSSPVPAWENVPEDKDDSTDTSSEDSSEETSDETSDSSSSDLSCGEVEVVQVVEPEKEKEKTKYNENELNDMKRQLKESDRQFKVAEEISKDYKKEIEAKEAMMAKFKAAEKHWKGVAERKDKEKETAKHELLVKLYAMEEKYNNMKAELKRMTKEYEFLRDIYENDERNRKNKKVRVTRKYTNDKDFKKFGKNDK